MLWDHQSCDLKQSFCSMQGLESLHFDHSGEKFVSSHSDGSLSVWNLREDAEPKCESPCESPCPFGPFPCKAITKVCWFEPYTIFSGGMPRASYGDRHCISVICGDSTQATFDFTSRVVDFFIIFDKHDKSKCGNIKACSVLKHPAMLLVKWNVLDISHSDSFALRIN